MLTLRNEPLRFSFKTGKLLPHAPRTKMSQVWPPHVALPLLSREVPYGAARLRRLRIWRHSPARSIHAIEFLPGMPHRRHDSRRRKPQLSLRGGARQMQIAPVFERVFKRIYGKPCWGVRPSYGSFLTLEFGKPHLEIREPVVASRNASAKVRESLARRGACPKGEWHLWIYCCDWVVLFNRKRIGDSSTKLRIRRAADFLNGQKLIRFVILPRRGQSVFEFDLGTTLKTRPYDRKSEQWLLYEKGSRRVLLVRADGCYMYKRCDLPRNQRDWRPIGISPSRI